MREFTQQPFNRNSQSSSCKALQVCPISLTPINKYIKLQSSCFSRRYFYHIKHQRFTRLLRIRLSHNRRRMHQVDMLSEQQQGQYLFSHSIQCHTHPFSNTIEIPHRIFPCAITQLIVIFVFLLFCFFMCFFGVLCVRVLWCWFD